MNLNKIASNISFKLNIMQAGRMGLNSFFFK